jgi:hypothetical protein
MPLSLSRHKSSFSFSSLVEFIFCHPLDSDNKSENKEVTEEKPEKPKKDGPPRKKKKTELSLRDEIELEMKNGPGIPPEV